MRNPFFALILGIFILCFTFIQTFSQKIVKADFSEKETSGSFEQSDGETARKSAANGDTIRTNYIYGLKRGQKEFSVEYGVSPFNPSNFAGPKEFDVYGRDLHLFSLRFGRIIGTKKNVTYQYLFGVTPLALFHKNEVKNPAYISVARTPYIQPTKREMTYAVAVQPVNFKFIFFAKKRLKPYAQTGAGILYANKAVPVPRSTKFQLTGDFGGGLMYMLSEKRAVSLGYKYFHISNGNIGGKINNPGFNANVFYLDYSFFWK